MAVQMVAGYGWVLITLIVNLLLTQWMAIRVGRARKQYKVFYPTMYDAQESENKDAKLAVQLCAERPPERFGVPADFSCAAAQYPIAAAVPGALYNVARIQYATRHPAARNQTGGVLHGVAHAGLLVCTIALILHQIFPAEVMFDRLSALLLLTGIQ